MAAWGNLRPAQAAAAATMEDGVYVRPDLTEEKHLELESIWQHKQELLGEIQRLRWELREAMSEVKGLEANEGSKTLQRNQKMGMVSKKLNTDPQNGIQFLVENKLLQHMAEDVAHFLYEGEGLNKTAISDYLGKREEFSIGPLHAFVEFHEFIDLKLVQALRQFLWSFWLLVKARKMDQMMEALPQRCCLCNPSVFPCTDTCYVLSFTVIMLNTSLHNPNMRDKPSAKCFIMMNHGINNGGDLPKDLLENLYESIHSKPFKIPEDDGNDLAHTFFNPNHEGWLLKLGGRWVKMWKVEDPQKLHCFELYIPKNKGQLNKSCKTKADGYMVEWNDDIYGISAPTCDQKEKWIKPIWAAVNIYPFYQMLATCKKHISVKNKQEQP